MVRNEQAAHKEKYRVEMKEEAAKIRELKKKRYVYSVIVIVKIFIAFFMLQFSQMEVERLD